MSFYLAYTLRHLGLERRRTGFVLFCIAVGVAAVVGLRTLGRMIDVALASSLQEAQHADIQVRAPSSLDDHHVAVYDFPGEQGSGALQGAHQIAFSRYGQNLLRRWAEQNGYEIQPLWDNGGPFTRAFRPGNNSTVEFIQVYCVDRATYPFYGKLVFDQPPAARLSDLLGAPGSAVVSRGLAAALAIGPGDSLSLTGTSAAFTVTGIADPLSETSLSSPFSGTFPFAYLDYETCQARLKIKPTRYALRAPPGSDLYTARSQLLDIFPGLQVTTTHDLRRSMAEFSLVFTRLVTMIGLISLLLGGIGIANTMLVAISRRAQEIAVLKTIGVQAGQITLLFLVEAGLLGIAGSLLGAAGGLLLALGLKQAGERFVAQSVPFQIDLPALLIGFGLGLFTTLAFALLPVLAAARVRPLRLLHSQVSGLAPAGGGIALIVTLLLTLLFGLISGWIVGSTLTGMALAFGALLVLGLLGLVLRGLLSLLIHLPAFGWVSLRLAQRSLRTQAGRGASTLLALVVGIFSLGVIWIFVQGSIELVQNSAEELLGGNVIVTVNSYASSQALEKKLERLPGLQGYLHDSVYQAEIIAINGNQDLQALAAEAARRAGSSYSPEQVKEFARKFKIKVREPDTWSYQVLAGSDLDPGREDQLLLENGFHSALIAAYGLKPGDTLTFRFPGGARRTLTICGQSQRHSGGILLDGLVDLRAAYGIVLKGAVPPALEPMPSPFILSIAPDQANQALQAISKIEGVVFVETRLLDEYTRRFAGQFLPLPVMMAILALFASSVIIANSVTLAMLERRRQIGILKAIGLQSEQVVGLLLLENGLLGLLGGVLGSGLSSLVILSYPTFGSIPGGFPVEIAVFTAALAFAVSLLATLFSVLGPAQEKPLQVLRYE